EAGRGPPPGDVSGRLRRGRQAEASCRVPAVRARAHRGRAGIRRRGRRRRDLALPISMIRRFAAALAVALTALLPSVPGATQAPPAPMVTAVEVVSPYRLSRMPPEQLLTPLAG